MNYVALQPMPSILSQSKKIIKMLGRGRLMRWRSVTLISKNIRGTLQLVKFSVRTTKVCLCGWARPPLQKNS